MTSEPAKSSSSGKAESSENWPDVVRLGDRIVKELGLADSIDTLGRWMAHRVAELIEAAEDDEAVKEQASDLILRLWGHRSDWPHGWPPARAETVRHVVDRRRRRLKESDDSVNKEAGPWIGRFDKLSRLQEDELDIWKQLGLAAIDFSDELDAVEDLDSHLSQEERSYLINLKMAVDAARRHFQDELGDDSEDPVKRAELAKRELRVLGRKRGVLFREALAEQE